MCSRKYFRSMLFETDGTPKKGRKGGVLGVRFSGEHADVVVTNGLVKPKSGGMTVYADCWDKIDSHWLPMGEPYNGSAPEFRKLKVYHIIEDHLKTKELEIHPPPEDDADLHTHVCPIQEIDADAYQNLLEKTHQYWNENEVKNAVA